MTTKKRHPKKLRVGDIVNCKGQFRRVVGLIRNVKGGVKLDEPVGIFRSWNEDELVFVKHASKDWLRENAHLVES